MTHPTSIPAEDTLRKTDAFSLCVYPPADGLLRTEITLGSAPAVTLTLAAAQDELTKLRAWMEDIARGISPALVSFADGTALSCRREYDDETGFAKTERFLDEEYPTGISTFCVRDAQGTEYGALIKTKHFLNLLYMEVLLDRKPSHLVEWYLSCREALPKRFPHFKSKPIRKATLKMWADFADAVFWQGSNIGDYNYLHIDDTYIDLSDISSLETWYDDFYLLASEDDMHTKPPFAIIGEEARQEWHVRGLKIAESLRSRIPQHYVFVYMQSWPLADLTPYFANDCGRIIFDERFIAEDT